MAYFENIKSLEDLKNQYKALVKINHPDAGGSVEVMQAINAEYDQLFNWLKAAHNMKATANGRDQMTEAPEEFRETISKLIHLSGLIIEICGSWIWVSGETYMHREALKAAGCRWASKKAMWYWRNESDACRSRHCHSIEQIREKYGSERFKSKGVDSLAPA